MLRQHIDEAGLLDRVGMVQAHPMQHAAATVVAGGREPVEAELFHHLDHILAHLAKRIGIVVVAAVRLGTVAVATEIGRHHGETPGQIRRHAIPGQMRERVAVHQKQWRPLTAVTQNDVDAVHMQRFFLESLHHRRRLPSLFGRDAPAIDAICQHAWPASRERHCDLKPACPLAK